jgi:hypothetical protein
MLLQYVCSSHVETHVPEATARAGGDETPMLLMVDDQAAQ